MSKHTPGPWALKLYDGAPWAIRRADGALSVECECRQCRDGYPRQYDEIATCDSHIYGPTLQDARLIAAAPEMYDLLYAIEHKHAMDLTRIGKLLARIDGGDK